MVSSKLTDDQLLELALEYKEGDYSERYDVGYYQSEHNIVDGKDKIYLEILFFHYCKWSNDPINLKIFGDYLNLKRKTKQAIFIDKKQCTIELDKILGEYVKQKKRKEKEKRLSQVSSLKPKTQC